jgi:hypothetical protein
MDLTGKQILYPHSLNSKMGEIKALKHSLKKLKNQLSVCQGFKGE